MPLLMPEIVEVITKLYFYPCLSIEVITMTSHKVFRVTPVIKLKNFRGAAHTLVTLLEKYPFVKYGYPSEHTELPHGTKIIVLRGKKPSAKRNRVVIEVPTENKTYKTYETDLANGNAVALGDGNFNLFNVDCIYTSMIEFDGKEPVKVPMPEIVQMHCADSSLAGRLAKPITNRDGGPSIEKKGDIIHPLTNDQYRITKGDNTELTVAQTNAILSLMTSRPLQFPGQFMDIVFLNVEGIGETLATLHPQAYYAVGPVGDIRRLSNEELEGKVPTVVVEVVVSLAAPLHAHERPVKASAVSAQRPEQKSKVETTWIPQMNQFVKVVGHNEMYIISDYDAVTGEFILTLADSTRAKRADELTSISDGGPVIEKKVMVQGRMLRPMMLVF